MCKSFRGVAKRMLTCCRSTCTVVGTFDFGKCCFGSSQFVNCMYIQYNLGYCLDIGCLLIDRGSDDWQKHSTKLVGNQTPEFSNALIC